MKTFSSQICTTIEQSKRLLELGLKPETSDMIHMQIDGSWICVIYQGDEEYIPYEDHFPAWSLHRLIELMDVYEVVLDWKFGIYECAISMLEERIRDGLISRKYLEQ